jgi:hypothetical protein
MGPIEAPTIRKRNQAGFFVPDFNLGEMKPQAA